MLGLTKVISSILVFFNGLVNNYGVAIILVTLVIRIALFPLYKKQVQMTEGMKVIQPKQKELQEKYKDKPEEYQKRLMELYKEHKINPLGGCLPLLVQMPILIALFNVLRNFNFGTDHFLWIRNLGTPDPLYILPILSAATTWYQMKITTTDKAQQSMVMIMPLFIGWMSVKFPAGLNLYWVVGNVFSITQQVLMSRKVQVAKEEAK